MYALYRQLRLLHVKNGHKPDYICMCPLPSLPAFPPFSPCLKFSLPPPFSHPPLPCLSSFLPSLLPAFPLFPTSLQPPLPTRSLKLYLEFPLQDSVMLPVIWFILSTDNLAMFGVKSLELFSPCCQEGSESLHDGSSRCDEPDVTLIGGDVTELGVWCRLNGI